jgi:hypothetical protein
VRDVITALAATLIVASVATRDASALQRTISVDTTTLANRGTVSLERVAVLDGSQVAGEPLAVVRYPDGRIAVSFYPDAQEVVEFDASGRYSRVLAPNGKGPGEVSAATHLTLDAGDSLTIFDSGRILRMNQAGGLLSTFVALPFMVQDAVPIGPDTLVVNANYLSADHFGLPLHVLVGYRRVERSFGSMEPHLFQPNQPYQIQRSITSDGRTGVWSAPRTSYVLERWNAGGDLIERWERPAGWFEPYRVMPPVSADDPPRPWLAAIQELRPGRVMVLINLARPAWRQHLGNPQRNRYGNIVYPEADYAAMRYTLLEVIDFERGRGRVVAAGHFDGALSTFADAEHVVEYRQAPDGTPTILIHRVSVGSVAPGC